MHKCNFFLRGLFLLGLFFGCFNYHLLAMEKFSNQKDLTGVSCIGPESAKKFMIYLHGMDSKKPSQQELQNRTVLEELAKKYKIRFALPRAKAHCPNNAQLICWGWAFDRAELEKTIPEVLASRRKCFSNNATFGMIGFSNGGYLLTSWYAVGMKLKTDSLPNFLVTVGSGQQSAIQAIYLGQNPKFKIVIGTLDQYNYDPDKKLFLELKHKKAPVELVEFHGGHTMDLKVLSKVLDDQSFK